MTCLVDLYFSEADSRAIADAVTRAEATTSGEIAVEVVESVSNWNLQRIAGILIGFCLGAAISLWLSHDTGWGMYYDITQGLLWGILGAMLGYVIARFLIGSQNNRASVVWETAIKRFGNLPSTGGNTAVLIFIGLEESHGVVVADQKIAEKVTQDEWDQIQSELTRNLRLGRHSEGIISSVSRLGTVLAQHFPRQSDDMNELPNAPKIG